MTVRNQEWLDRASDSRYPFNWNASAVDETGTFAFPNDFLTSVYIAIPADLKLNLTTVHISEIIHTPTLITLSFQAAIDGEPVVFAKATLSVTGLEAQIEQVGYGFGLIEGELNYPDVRGRLTVARVDNLRLQPAGVFQFGYAATGLDTDALRPNIRHVSAIEIESAGSITRLNRVIRLKPGNNARLRVTTEDGEPVVYVDALDPTGFNDNLDCETTVAAAVRRINGLPGNSDREIFIQPSRCIEITPAGNALNLRNACSEPCAGCAEAEAIKSQIDPMAQQIPILTNFISRLTASVEAQQQAIAASQGPLSCLQQVEPEA